MDPMDSIEVAPGNSSPGDDGNPTSPTAASGSQASQASLAAKKAAARKRTKTGCLTCRRRRIKCDEGKPTCNNCIKSKRQCEGYNQRLTFKEPLGTFPSGALFSPTYYPQHQQSQETLINAHLSAAEAKAAASQGPLAMLAPKPPSVDFTGTMPMQFGHIFQGMPEPSGPGLVVYSPQKPLPTPPIIAPPESTVLHAQNQAPNHLGFYHAALSPPDFDENRIRKATSPGTSRYHEDPLFPIAAPRLSDRDEAGYWQSDDEASMVESDDEQLPDTHLAHLESNDLGIQVAKRLQSSLDVHGIRLRTFSNPAADYMLGTYTPSSSNSPLNDPHTAAVFWYFVNVTGPSMSLYERHPFDPAPVFQGQYVPKARRHIWTYIFPIIAFSHPALMQAILALGSLQMANLQGLPSTAAMKHYHLSLRRVAKNYQSHTKRTQPATLAATLLLGFYEVWNSDHEKWCKHMWGARAILREMPLREMTREVLELKRKARQSQLKAQMEHVCDGSCLPQHCAPDGIDLDEIDTGFISQITGQHVSYTQELGQVLDGPPRSTRSYTENDIETYETISDLYWWFCKMDIYQSVLGGTRPFMEYDHWTQCAPRAPFGRIDAVYGTFDHLMLLLGRLVNFASRDLARKRKTWRPGPPGQASPGQGPPGRGAPGPGPPGRGPPPGPPPAGPPLGHGRGQGRGQGPAPPMFPGLMPTNGHFSLPKGFSPPREKSPSADLGDDVDLDASTAAAHQEWEEIRQAFEMFRNRLGPEFAPLGPELAVAEMTPFGEARTYRTFSIAGIWLNFYMGLVVLYRSHPSMPPFAMAAAGIAARQTAAWASEIPRIAAGICEDLNNAKAVSTLVGSALIESCFCLFVSGIQFQATDQRHWIVKELHSISRLTGWQSARQIADGCESAWIKASQMNRGPPYHSPEDLGPLYPESVWSMPRRIDRRMQEYEGLDNRLVLARTEQAHYALGLLSVEQDLDRLDLVEAD